jgi:hypothetical protein
MTASANSTGAFRAAFVTLGDQSAVLTQPATPCSYSPSQQQISAPASGVSGTINVTTTCPVVASSNEGWLSATNLGASVQYTVAPNVAAARTATLTIGTGAVAVNQAAGFSPCDVNQDGSTDVRDVQQIINEALGNASGVDLTLDGLINVVDVQIVINAALGLSCMAG